MLNRFAQIVLLLGPTLAGCGREPRDQPVCPPSQAAFELTVQTPNDEPLPRGTRVSVEYGGAESEAYKVGFESRGNEVLCCAGEFPGQSPQLEGCGGHPVLHVADSGPEVAGGASKPPTALMPAESDSLWCELWTNGAARLRVSAPGYVTAERLLEVAELAEPDGDCDGLETREVTVILYLPEAGTLSAGQ